MDSHKQWLLALLPWIIFICIYCILTKTTAQPEPPSNSSMDISGYFQWQRKNVTTKDADMIIKMTRDFIMDMQQKMIMVKRIQRNYLGSAQFATGIVLSDIFSRFRRMCDLYKKYATIRRYVLEKGLNQSMAPSPDVVIIFQIMLSDYNEIMMQIELYKTEHVAWKEGEEAQVVRELVKKQLLKFGNIPAQLTPPPIVDHNPDLKPKDEGSG